MRKFLITIILAIFGLICCCIASADSADSSGTAEKTGSPDTIVLEAPTIVAEGTVYKTVGDSLLYSGVKKIYSSGLSFDSLTGSATINHAVITSCNEHPSHFSIEASKIKINKSGWVDARDLSVRLGRIRIFYLPWMKMKFSAKGGTTASFPQVWYDSLDGLILRKKIVLAKEDRISALINTEITQKSGIRYSSYLEYGIDGILEDPQGRTLNSSFLDPGSILSLREVMKEFKEPNINTPSQKMSRFRLYTNYTVQGRIDDADNKDLEIYQRPETGVKYIGHPLDRFGNSHDPRLMISPQLDVSWSRFREEPSAFGTIRRTKISASAAFNFIDVGKYAAIQPVLNQTWLKYNELNDFQVFTYGLDASRIYSNGSFMSMRYLERSKIGNTPLEYDDVDIDKEYQYAVHMRAGSHLLGLMSSYDVDRNKLYDWEVSYGYGTDCMDISGFFNGRLKRIGVSLSLKNL